MKLSIVILCWNDRGVIENCLRSIFAETHLIDFEVIVCDNGSTDTSLEFIREAFPQVRIIENGRNLRFAKANNVGIRASSGEYVLILNPDTIIHESTLDRLVSIADQHPEAGAFGCRVLNPDGSYQPSAWPFSTLKREWLAAFFLRGLARLGSWLTADTYAGWLGTTERQVDWVSGCFILARRTVLESINGFDEQFFYYYEDMDLCRRIWAAGHPILYLPSATIIHLGGQSTKSKLPALGFLLDSQVTRYLYYQKYYGARGVRLARRLALVSLALRIAGYTLKNLMRPNEQAAKKRDTLTYMFRWTYRLDPVRLVSTGEEPRLEFQPAGRVTER